MTTITIERALLEQALEALELVTEDYDDSAVGLEIEAIQALRAALAAPATDDRHAQELLAQDITIANMRERHAQELCAYELTVQNLLAERKPMTDEQIETMWPSPEGTNSIHALVRAVEAHHGIGDKT